MKGPLAFRFPDEIFKYEPKGADTGGGGGSADAGTARFRAGNERKVAQQTGSPALLKQNATSDAATPGSRVRSNAAGLMSSRCLALQHRVPESTSKSLEWSRAISTLQGMVKEHELQVHDLHETQSRVQSLQGTLDGTEAAFRALQATQAELDGRLIKQERESMSLAQQYRFKNVSGLYSNTDGSNEERSENNRAKQWSVVYKELQHELVAANAAVRCVEEERVAASARFQRLANKASATEKELRAALAVNEDMERSLLIERQARESLQREHAVAVDSLQETEAGLRAAVATAAESHAAELRAANAAADAATETAETLRAGICALELQLVDARAMLQATHDEHAKALDEKEARIEALRQEIDFDYRDFLSSKADLLERAAAAEDLHRAQVHALQADLSASRAAQTSVAREKAAAEAQIEALRGELSDAAAAAANAAAATAAATAAAAATVVNADTDAKRTFQLYSNANVKLREDAPKGSDSSPTDNVGGKAAASKNTTRAAPIPPLDFEECDLFDSFLGEPDVSPMAPLPKSSRPNPSASSSASSTKSVTFAERVQVLEQQAETGTTTKTYKPTSFKEGAGPLSKTGGLSGSQQKKKKLRLL